VSGYGIGAGGQLGIAFEVLLPPVATSATPAAGGALTAGTYKYYITAINALGETTVSNELTGTTSAGNLTLTLLWAAVSGATGYKIYRTAAGGATGTELLLATVGAVTTYNDAAVGAPAGAFPTANTAFATGIYTAPTKYVPFNNETIKNSQDTKWRRPIRKSADVIGAIPGNFHVEGDIELEVMEDVILYFLYAGRTSCSKTGAGPNYVYTFSPTADAIPTRTLSLTFERTSGVVFGYTGCTVSAFKFNVSDGIFMCTVTIIGRDEASQSTPTPTFPSTVPFGAGQYSIEVPTGTQVFDTDTFEFTVDDAGEAQFRLKNNTRGAQFVKFGERTCTAHLERDFLDRTDFDAYKAYTSQSITLTATKGTNNSVSLVAPVAIKDTYETNLSGQGDLIRANINYQNVLGSPAAYQIVVKSQENIV
jgi:hypothetical protein